MTPTGDYSADEFEEEDIDDEEVKESAGGLQDKYAVSMDQDQDDEALLGTSKFGGGVD